MAIPTEKPSYGPLDGVKVVYAAGGAGVPTKAMETSWPTGVPTSSGSRTRARATPSATPRT